MNFPIASLRKVCEFLDHKRIPVKESDRKPGPYPYYGANGQQGWIDGYIFDEPLVLLAEDGGHFGSKTKPIAYKVTGKCWVNNHAHVLRPKSNCDIEYLTYVLSFYDVTKYISGTTRAKLTKEQASKIEIPLPPLDEQRRIAARLSRADQLRRLRRYASQLGEGYLEPTFIEIFGDPETNSMGWEKVKVGEKLDFITSGSRGWAKHYSKEGELFLRVQNIGANRLLLDDVAYVQAPNNAESRRTKVKEGDLLLSATADLGRTGVIPKGFPTAYINQHLFILRLKKDMNPYFVAGYFSTKNGKAQILKLDREGVKSGLNFDDVKSLEIFYPPLAEQERFAAKVARYERLRSQQREAEKQTEMLFQSLLSQSFGES
jgi:type I restriction enzyme S subunit